MLKRILIEHIFSSNARYVVLIMSVNLIKSLGYGGIYIVKIKGGQHQGKEPFLHGYWLDENHNRSEGG